MSGLSLFPVFIVGLFGSVHCAGMCGGIVSAFSSIPMPQRAFPIAVVTRSSVPALDSTLRVLSYNTGRIGSYAMVGAIAGALAGGAGKLAVLAPWQLAGFWLANLMLVLLGLYLMDAWRGITVLEAAGNRLWRHLRPLMRFMLPLDSPFKLLALGALWGWLPCGMVYSVLVTAMLSGSAGSGAAIMLAFGLGTLPMLIAMGMAGTRLRALVQRRGMQRVAGAVVLAFGFIGLWRAAGGTGAPWLDLLCMNKAVA
jgi:sulfite exporter TauE/SafE